MSTPLRLLMVEDNPSDAELILHSLRHAGYDPIAHRVETEDDYLVHLQTVPELILADFSMPQFDSLRALEIMKARALDIPFIIVSGSIGEERAVQAMQRGATDYIIKDRLGRLGQAVAQALEKQRLRNETRRAERRLWSQHAVTQTLAESPTLAAASGKILCAIGQSLGWDFGALWQLGKRESVLLCVECWRNPSVQFADFETSTRQGIPASGKSFPRQILATGQAVWLADITREFYSARVSHAARVGLHSAFGFPIILGTKTLGILEFFSREVKQPDDDTLKMMLAIGRQLGQYIERKRAEASLRQSNQTLQALIQAAPLAIITLDQRFLITMWNSTAEQIFGWQEAEVLGRPLPMILEWGQKESEIRSRNELTAAREQGLELRVLHKNGSMLDVNLWTAPVIDAQGLVVGTMDLFLDVTGRKSLEEQFRQSQKMEAVGQLAGGVAHDFNNLLTIISGYSELLLGEPGPEIRSRDLLREIQGAGERAASLTRQLLAFSRKQVLAPVVMELNALVTETEKLLRRLIGEDIDLRVVLAPDLGHVRADPGQLDQILLNLAVNARDAMPTGGSLTIETRNVHLDESYAQRFQEVRPGPYVMLAVTDTGCGMNEEVKARMFEPFFTTKGVGQGTGLGLATVFGVVKQSGGHIAVYSEPGKGTSFKIYMPRVEGEVRASGSHPGFAKIPGGTETILLVEDEDAVRRLGRLVLETNGYTVVEAGDGEQALRICEQYPDPIHLIVTDVIMPHIGGRELADRLLALLPTLKVLYLSGYTDDAIIRHGVLDSTMAFLQKPFTNMALARKVREVLDQ